MRLVVQRPSFISHSLTFWSQKKEDDAGIAVPTRFVFYVNRPASAAAKIA
jgi:hypothetical protein